MAADATTLLFFREAIARALREEMRHDPALLLLGQDIGSFGGPYRDFDGLLGEFGPGRVRDTPVAEAGMVALGVGAAAAGMRTLVAITYMDFLLLGLDPLVNYAARLHFKTAEQLQAPVVIKTTAGAKGQGVAHSQCLEAWLMGVPGLTVLAPSTPADAYGLLKAALRAPGPVVFIDHKRLFQTSGPVPVAETVLPLGQAALRRAGSHATIATHGYMTIPCLAAATALAAEGIEVEVLDLRSLAPLDVEAVAASAARTGALLTVEEGQLTCGVGAEVAFRVRERVDGLRVARLGPLPVPVSSNPVLEAACLPDAPRIAAALRRLLDTPRQILQVPDA